MCTWSGARACSRREEHARTHAPAAARAVRKKKRGDEWGHGRCGSVVIGSLKCARLAGAGVWTEALRGVRAVRASDGHGTWRKAPFRSIHAHRPTRSIGSGWHHPLAAPALSAPRPAPCTLSCFLSIFRSGQASCSRRDHSSKHFLFFLFFFFETPDPAPTLRITLLPFSFFYYFSVLVIIKSVCDAPQALVCALRRVATGFKLARLPACTGDPALRCVGAARFRPRLPPPACSGRLVSPLTCPLLSSTDPHKHHAIKHRLSPADRASVSAA